MIKFTLNGREVSTEDDPNTPLLWVVREQLGLNGTKFGCGVSLCGACTVHMDGMPVRSCITPVSSAEGRSITTIEGIAEGDSLHPVQQAWIDEQVPQCGYCQSGQIMSAVGLLSENARPTVEEIDLYMDGNACRCATYQRIRAAIQRASDIMEA